MIGDHHCRVAGQYDRHCNQQRAKCGHVQTSSQAVRGGRHSRVYPDEQIIGFLKQVEGGVPVKDLCRKHGFSDATFYKWRSRLGGLDVSEARRLRELESENTKLKKLLAEAMLDIESLKVVARGKR